MLALSSGSWVGPTGQEHAADFIQTSKGYLIYIISDEPFDDEVGLFGSLGRGFLVGVFAIIIFVTLTYYYIKIRLKPIQLMQNRVRALQEGDLESKIEIMGTDELAELSIIFNKLILDIKNLINQKHRVLLDVSHELKTPLTRMRLLLEIMPDNKQKEESQETNLYDPLMKNDHKISHIPSMYLLLFEIQASYD